MTGLPELFIGLCVIGMLIAMVAVPARRIYKRAKADGKFTWKNVNKDGGTLFLGLCIWAVILLNLLVN